MTNRWSRAFGTNLAVLVVLLLWGKLTAAQGAAPGTTSASSPVIAVSGTVPDLSGIWELRYNSRHVQPASLTPEAIRAAKDAQAVIRAGHTIQPASRWCYYKGVPFMMGQSPPNDIVQTRDEIAIFAEQISSARHIYMDGRGHPDPNTYEPTTNGHSIGHWEGDNLVVDTVGFNDQGILMIPGGGYRTHTSHLVERFHLLNGGDQLSVTFTWEDRKIFLKPHTYDFTYYKMPPDAYVLEDTCDSSDTAKWQDHSTTEPAQQ